MHVEVQEVKRMQQRKAILAKCSQQVDLLLRLEKNSMSRQNASMHCLLRSTHGILRKPRVCARRPYRPTHGLLGKSRVCTHRPFRSTHVLSLLQKQMQNFSMSTYTEGQVDL